MLELEKKKYKRKKNIKNKKSNEKRKEKKKNNPRKEQLVTIGSPSTNVIPYVNHS
jgi:hypothetical protein